MGDDDDSGPMAMRVEIVMGISGPLSDTARIVDMEKMSFLEAMYQVQQGMRIARVESRPVAWIRQEDGALLVKYDHLGELQPWAPTKDDVAATDWIAAKPGSRIVFGTLT